VKETALTYGGNEYVVIAIVVVVADGDAHAIHADCQSRLLRNIGKGSVAIVVIELQRRGTLGSPRPVFTVCEQNVGPSVVVVIDEGNPRSQRLW